MNNRFMMLASLTFVLLLITTIGGQNVSATSAGFTNKPSFGSAGMIKYTDGLVINGNTIDASKYSQKITTPQILSIGKSSTIALKIFDNAGPNSVKVAGLYMNMKGSNLSTSAGDTSIIYRMSDNTFSITDPHKLLGKVTAEYKISKPFVYVTFHVTPIAKMGVSNLSIAAMDDHRAFVSSLLINAIQFS